MGRTCLYSFAGAGVGFLVGIVIVQLMVGASAAHDTTAITMFAGTFLSGAGAIAGAITGGVAECSKKTEQARAAQVHRQSESQV